MLNDKAVERLNHIIEVIGTEQLDAGEWEVGEFKWLVETIGWMNARYNDHENCCISPCTDADKIKELKLEIDQLKGKA